MATVQNQGAPSDAALMERMRERNSRALGVLYDRHAAMVFSVAAAIVGRAEDAEEVTEDVFMQIWTSAERFDAARGALTSWLATIARRRALDVVRARNRRRSAHERAAASDDSGMAVGPSAPAPPDRDAERSDLRGRVSRALDVLSEDQRRAIELAYFEGLTQSEIADRLEEPLGTVKTRIRDGMLKLRKLFATAGEALG